MKRWWTADLHLSHGNILKYCSRPFRDAEHMQESFAREFNQRVKKGDVVMHLGDLGTKGRDHGVEGPRVNPMTFLSQFNGTWVLLEGNHDSNNRVKTVGQTLFGEIGNYRFVARHAPLNHESVPVVLKQYCNSFDVCLCGHVHEKWKTRWIDGLLHINVGVDVNRFRPLDDSGVIGIIEQERRMNV